MAITYPLALPTHTGIRSINLRAVQQTGMTMSPFTYKQQVVVHPGQRWEAEITLPVMQRTNAEAWVGWLLSLRGRSGTFLLGDPLATSPIGNGGGTPVVKGASQTGSTLLIDGCTASQSSYLAAGDYIQLGSAASSQLYKVTQTAASDGSGNATLEIWPDLRSSPADNATITVNATKGLFRLATNETDWSINEASIFGLTFPAIEVIT
jgi:hypothetical protein